MSNKNVPIEYNNKIVVSTRQIAVEHGLEVKVVNQKFRRNKKYFTENVDYWEFTKKSAPCEFKHLFYNNNEIISFLTEDVRKKMYFYFSKPKKQSRYIYLIRQNNYYKIGVSINPKDRYKKYLTENPLPIELIYFEKCKNAKSVESSFIKKNKDFNIHHEWFLFENHKKEQIINILKGVINENN